MVMGTRRPPELSFLSPFGATEASMEPRNPPFLSLFVFSLFKKWVLFFLPARTRLCFTHNTQNTLIQ